MQKKYQNMSKSPSAPPTKTGNKCLFFATCNANLTHLAEYLPLQLDRIVPFTDFAKAQEALNSGEYSSIFCDDTCWSHECEELLDFASLVPGMRILCSTKRPMTDFSSEFWVLNSQYIFYHLRNDKDNLIKPLNSLFKSSTHLRWVSDMTRQFKNMRMKLKDDDMKVILLIGASGTAKSALAQISHYRSERKKGKVIFLNCKPQTNIDVVWDEAQKNLFRDNIIRLLSEANGGMFYVHEIDHIDKEAQEIFADIFSKKKILVDNGNERVPFKGVAIFSARHTLEDMVETKKFSKALYAALKENVMHVPSMNEYSEEIPEIASEILKTICHQHNTPVKRFTKDAIDFFKSTIWTRNLRDIMSTVKNAAFMTSGIIIKRDKLSAPHKPDSTDSAYDKRRLVKDALTECNGSVTKAAEKLGVKRDSVYRWMRELNIPTGWGRKKKV